MNIIETSHLSENQKELAARLSSQCCQHDHIHLSYPAFEEGNDLVHFLLFDDSGQLSAALALILLDENLAECVAFTRPDKRRRGFFSLLLSRAMHRFEQLDLMFTVSEDCPDTLAVLAHLDAEKMNTELQMELCLDARTEPDARSLVSVFSKNDPELVLTSALQDPDISWILYHRQVPVAHCLTAQVSESCVCLHHVETDPELRRKGYATALIAQTVDQLWAAGIRRILLQVSGTNQAAIALYKKAGFRITETLSCYLY